MNSNLTFNELKRKWASAIAPSNLPQDVAIRLLSAAFEARGRAYAPYSSFKVGAAVLTEDGKTFSGSNIENASYGATMCAERVAIFKAISSGHKTIKAVSVVADYPTPIPPCGICRQVAIEFGKKAVVLMSNTVGEIKIEKLDRLLPSAFEFSKTDEE
ncbi:Cytidine deaminase [subsurface metagenome]